MVTRDRTMTIEDYRAFYERPENSDRIFELIDGEIVEKMPSYKPSKLAGVLIYWLNHHVLPLGIGDVTVPDGGYIMSEDDGQIFIPDVAYISRARMPEEPSREVPVPPDFAIEVKSPTDRVRNLRHKAERYLEYGTRLVWLVFPDEKRVEVYTPDDDVRVFDIDDTLSGGDVLPGFTLPVRAIFES